MRFRMFMLCCAISPCATCLCGCAPKRVAIEGNVTLDGQPLDEAVIVFVPAVEGRKKTGAKIATGKYRLAQADGLLPGEYRVEIADDPPLALAHADAAAQPSVLAARRALPRKYAHDSPLQLELTRGGPVTFDFELSSAP